MLRASRKPKSFPLYDFFHNETTAQICDVLTLIPPSELQLFIKQLYGGLKAIAGIQAKEAFGFANFGVELKKATLGCDERVLKLGGALANLAESDDGD